MLTPIADALVALLNVFHGWTGSYGWSVILLTLAIKLALHPLTRKQLRSMKAMQALGPQMQALREKYRDNPQQMNIEIMNLYRSHGVNPLAGCLPMLVQLPVLWALFIALRRQGLFGGETFLGAALDRVPTFAAIRESPILAIYPVLVGASTYLQQRLTVTDPQQARMFVFMPVLVAWFATQVQVGLSLYWIVSTLAYAVEYLLIVGRPGTAPSPRPAAAVLPQRPGGVKKK
ncbi:MAG: YidC/Oxa1 family membrane protein insertase [Armatimonadota bacterium]|nr:YidC/Oxa1 family membrane protein insertase [Armatimonadota bacterium]